LYLERASCFRCLANPPPTSNVRQPAATLTCLHQIGIINSSISP
jgi:hypothetical protein